MKMKKYLLIAGILITATAFGQDDKIDADRPTEAQSAQVVSPGTFQAELGVRKQQEQGSDVSWQYPEALFRYGLFDRVELRLHTAVESQHFYSENKFSDGVNPVELGIKANVFQTKDTSFIAALYGHIGLPRLASKDYRHNTTFYRVRALFQNKLSEKIKLNTNFGRDWDNNKEQQNWMYAISPQFEIGEKWEATVEEQAFFKKNSKPEHFVDGGIGYFVGNNLKLDVNAGKGLGGEAADYFFTAGVSFKL